MNEPRSVLIVGFLVAGAIILGLGFFLGGSNGSADVPPLRIFAPATGDTVTNPVTLTFATPAPLRLDPQHGWMADELHLHALADIVELMPAAGDISPLNDSTYAWRLPPLPPGPRRLYLTWAGRHHGNLDGVTDTVRFHVTR